MDRLLTFVRSGTVDGVGLGNSEDEVRGRLGHPDATSGTRPTIWKYGGLQLGFEASRVVMVLLTAEGGVDVPWQETADRQWIERVLAEGGLAYEPVAELSFDTQTTVRVLASGAVLTFDAERADLLVKAVVTAS